MNFAYSLSNKLIKFLRLLPPPLQKFLGTIRTSYRRLSIWRKVIISIRGYTSSDRKNLLHAYMEIPSSLFKDLACWQFPMVQESCTIISRGIGIFVVRGNSDDLFHALPNQEPAVETAIRSRLRAGDVFVDAGANIGFYTVLASQLVGGGGRVVAVEMIPETAAILRKHIVMNGCKNVEVFVGALALVSGDIVRAVSKIGKSGASSIVRQLDGIEIDVVTLALEDVLRNVRKVDLMKMDLEGAELGALQGLGSDLRKVESIIFENRHEPAAEAFLRANGYTIRQIDGSNALAERGRM